MSNEAEKRAMAQLEPGRARAEAGDRTGAEEALSAAEAAAHDIHNQEKAATFQKIAEALIGVGAIAKANAVLAAARRATKGMRDGWLKLITCQSLAETLHRIGEVEKAKATVTAARSVARRIALSVGDADSEYRSVAETQVRVGDLGGARKTTDKDIVGWYLRAEVWLLIACARAMAGEIAEAEALVAAAEALGEAERSKASNEDELAYSDTDPAYEALAAAKLLAGDIAAAQAAAQKIEGTAARDRARHSIAVVRDGGPAHQ